MNAERELAKLLETHERLRNTDRLKHYKPYPFQVAFHNAVGYQTTAPAVQRTLMCANQVGKSFCGAMEAAIHLTGRYPDWWMGHRFTKPIDMMIGGLTNESVKKICQKELFGEPTDDSKFGTGTVPIDCLDIERTTRKAGVPDAYESVLVKHSSGGWSNAMFMAYEQGAKKHMGHRIDLGWMDEEPPEDIWSQYIRGTLSTQGILYMTFTPEEGITKVVYSFLNDIKPGQALLRATWDDAPHMDHNRREQALGAIPSHQREMRSKGIPMMGSGLVFPVQEESIKCDPFEIPAHWPRICGIDFGISHPFAAAWVAWDRDTDCVYVYDAYREAGANAATHSSSIKKRGNWPIVWPHDGLNREKSSGEPLAELYRKEGLNMLMQQFSNPPAPGTDEGKGGNSVEYGIMDVLTRMEMQRLKIFSNLKEVWEEIRQYHRVDGKIVPLYDDLMSAMRYACLSIRHAQTATLKLRVVQPPRGPTNW